MLVHSLCRMTDSLEDVVRTGAVVTFWRNLGIVLALCLQVLFGVSTYYVGKCVGVNLLKDRWPKRWTTTWVHVVSRRHRPSIFGRIYTHASVSAATGRRELAPLPPCPPNLKNVAARTTRTCSPRGVWPLSEPNRVSEHPLRA